MATAAGEVQQQGFNKNSATKNGPVVEPVQTLELALIVPNPNQPRKDFTSEKAQQELAGLASSIRKEGVIQPIIVSQLLTEDLARIAIPEAKLPEGKTYADFVGKHLIIAGQRRWMASGMAGRKWIPSIVRTLEVEEGKVKNDALTILSATENLTRSDMTVYEEAMVYKYHEEQGWSHQQIATQYGKHRTHVANMLGILDLPKPVIDALAAGSEASGVSMGHARWLKSLKGHDEVILAILKRILEDGVSVRWVEEQVKEAQAKIKAAEAAGSDATEQVTGDISQAPKQTPAANAQANGATAGTPAADPNAAAAGTPAAGAPAAQDVQVVIPDEIVAALKATKNVVKTNVRYTPGETEGVLHVQIFGMADLARILKMLGCPAELADAVNKG